MSSVYSLATVLCICALAASLINFVSAHGVTRKLMNTVIGVFVAVCMIMPVKTLIGDFKLDYNVDASDIEAYSADAYNDTVLAETKSMLEARLLSLLAERGVKPKSVEVELKTKSDGGVYISEIRIYIVQSDSGKAGRISAAVEGEFGRKPVIEVN